MGLNSEELVSEDGLQQFDGGLNNAGFEPPLDMETGTKSVCDDNLQDQILRVDSTASINNVDDSPVECKIRSRHDLRRRSSAWEVLHLHSIKPTWASFIKYSISQKGRELSQGTSQSYALFLSVVGISLIVSEVLQTSAVSKTTTQSFFIAMYSMSFVSIVVLLIFGACGKLTRDEHYRHRGKINFIRGGMVVLGTGAIVYRSMLFTVFIISPAECRNYSNFVISLVGTAFTIAQIALLLIYTKVRINGNHGIAVMGRFLIMQIIGTNLCVWIATVVTESIEEINNVNSAAVTEATPATTPADMLSNNSNHKIISFSSSIHDQIAHLSTGNDTCDEFSQFIHYVIPYLFPLMIEFSVMASTMCLSIWENCGNGLGRKAKRKHKLQSMRRHGENPLENVGESTCSPYCNGNNMSPTKTPASYQPSGYYNSNIGFVLGWIVVAFTVVFVVIALYFIYQDSLETTIEDMSYASNMALSCLFLIATPLTFYQMTPLTFKDEEIRRLRHMNRPASGDQPSEYKGVHRSMDRQLLFQTFVALVIYKIMSMIAAYEHNSPIIFIDGVCSILMAFLQTFFVGWFAFQKRSTLVEHRQYKPGRQSLEFLRCGNFALWLINTFLLKNTLTKRVQYMTFGTTGWAIISNICQPLTILYYFHSMVVVANVITHSYSEKYIGLTRPSKYRRKSVYYM